MMRRYGIAIGLFILFLLEGTWMEWLIPPAWQSEVLVVPHLVLVGVILVALYKNRYQAFAYGLGFGMLQDFMYFGHALGVHSFSMGLIGYGAGLLFRLKPPGIIIGVVIGGLGSLGYDALVYSIYRLFLGVTRARFEWVLLHEMLPGLLFNTLMALLLILPARKWLETDESGREPEEK